MWSCFRSKFFPTPSNLQMSKVSPSRQRRILLGGYGRQIVCVYMLKRRGAKTDPCGKPFFRHQSLLGLLSSVVRMKLLFRTSSMIIRVMCLSGRSLSSLQVRPRCQTVSSAAVRSINTAPAFFFASNEFSMFCVSKTT